MSDTSDSIADDGTNGADPTPNNNSGNIATSVTPAVGSVPTASAGGLVARGLLLAAAGWWALRRRRRRLQ